MIKFLKKMLGVDSLEARLNDLENEKKSREIAGVTYQAEKQSALTNMGHRFLANELSNNLAHYLSKMNFELTEDNATVVKRTVSALEVMSTYNFGRFSPSQNHVYNSQVITIQDLKDHPEVYFHKLSKSYLTDVLGLNFSNICGLLSDGNYNIQIHKGLQAITFNLDTLLNKNTRPSEKTKEVSSIFHEAMMMSTLNRSDHGYVDLTSVDFLHNYNGITQFLIDREDLSNEDKISALQSLETIKLVYLSALEIALTSKIGDLSELFENEADNQHQVEIPSENKLVNSIKQSFLSELKGTNYLSLEKILPLDSKNKFRVLAYDITQHILSSDKQKEGLTNNINKPLEEYSIGEAIMLASYFARNVIDTYKKLEDSIEDIFAGTISESVKGKCTDYTGLAIHYLNEYIVPLQPEKFKNWVFGYDSDFIGNYAHCYLKAYHLNPDSSLTIYFADPTKLACSGIKELKNCDEVMRKVDAMNLPLLIIRNAEDLLYAAKTRIDNTNPCG